MSQYSGPAGASSLRTKSDSSQLGQGRMLVRVTCAGVLVGTAEFDSPLGLAHAPLVTTAGYACASAAAWRLARGFATTQYWSTRDGDFAGVAAGRWDGERLALEDETGRELGVRNIVLLEGLPGDGRTAVRVVADFRSAQDDVRGPRFAVISRSTLTITGDPCSRTRMRPQPSR